MTAQTLTLRASDFASPESAARRLNQVLNTLREQLAVPNRTKVDLPFVTDSGGTAPPLSIKPPNWPVKGIVQVYSWNLTLDIAAFLRVGWSYVSNQIVVTPYVGDLSPSTSYALRVELSDG